MRPWQAARYLLYGMCPVVGGKFTYDGTRVYFPRGSAIFRRSCEQRTYEPDVTACLCRLVQPGSWFIDVGANIGLTSLPVLSNVPGAQVLSFEPSPVSLLYLERTWRESEFGARWKLVPKAAGDSLGSVEFYASRPGNAAYDGLRDTKRGGEKHHIVVKQTTVETEWRRLGRPRVSYMKVDVEGAEIKVLKGSCELIERERPHVLLEWNQENLAPYQTDVGALVEHANSFAYEIQALPSLARVSGVESLKAWMVQTESFLMVPMALRTH